MTTAFINKRPWRFRIAAGVLAGCWIGLAALRAAPAWEETYQNRVQWWSLRPLANSRVPDVHNLAWPRNNLDLFILAEQEKRGLNPAPSASMAALARRLSFLLLGLPPHASDVEQLTRDPSPFAYEGWVDRLLASPHFGERWARHWMDVIHYTDTHGYEWDIPAKNAWRYRDYLVRAFNRDLPFADFIREHLAGDLLDPPRIDPVTGLNESIIGPMFLRMGERLHGDNAEFEGRTQPAVANMIDTVGKAFLATTVACSECHDHKLDAVSQADYYALAGVFMSSRWVVRGAEAQDPNASILAEISNIKTQLRREVSQAWTQPPQALRDGLQTLASSSAPPTNAPPPAFPESLLEFGKQIAAAHREGRSIPDLWRSWRSDLARLQRERRGSNETHFTLLADFSQERIPDGWHIEGLGLRHGWVRDGAWAVSTNGTNLIQMLLPAGRWSHVLSSRLEGAVRGPLFDSARPSGRISVLLAGGGLASQTLVVDHTLHSERMQGLKQPFPSWLTLPASVHQTNRRVYLEFSTAGFNNNYPPRMGHASGFHKYPPGAASSGWFGLTRVYQHLTETARPPWDTLERYGRLFEDNAAPANLDEASARLGDFLAQSARRWADDQATAQDVQILNEALAAQWLPNSIGSLPQTSSLKAAYHRLEQQLRPERTIGSFLDLPEAQDERIAIRGSYTDLGPAAPRGTIRILADAKTLSENAAAIPARLSGRLQVAASLAHPNNPLTARVFVNRVWHHLFGAGLVRTVDDFGHLGEQPSHPELLDWLAGRFIAEGGSLKKLLRLIVTSSAFRQSSQADPRALALDPENRWLHHLPARRLDAESIRDAMLAVSGRLNPALFGEPIDPYRAAEDSEKRLFSGPIDGAGRRSLYTKVTLMEPARFLAVFNQPLPKITVGKRDVTQVPEQALALLNDPLVLALARQWAEQAMQDNAPSAAARIERMFAAAFSRPPLPTEIERLARFVERSAQLRAGDVSTLLQCQPVWQDLAHALFNLREFIFIN